MTSKYDDLSREDEYSRNLAQTDFSCPIVLEAGAGTGKTAVLVARILNWCLGTGWEEEDSEDAPPEEVATKVIRSVVAITFTKAAAREMSTRVRDALWNLVKGRIPHGMSEKLLPSAYRERAAILLPHLDLLFIGTIHSFCENILSKYAIQAGLHPKFKIDDEPFVLSKAVVRDAISEELELGLGNLPDENWLHLAKEGISLADLESCLISDLIDNSNATRLFGSIIENLFDDSSFRGDYLAGCIQLVKAGRNVTNARSKEVITAAEQSLSAAKNLNLSLENLASFWSEKTSGLLNEWMSEVKARDRKSLGDNVDALIESACIVAPKVKILLKLDAKTFSSLHHVLGAVWRSARIKMEQRGIVRFDEILVRTEALLRTDDETRNTLRHGFSQILIDEFQDTNKVQCQIVKMLTLADGPEVGLFVVGDPKQSIFGFRNADLRAYEEFVEEIDRAGGTKLLLSVNFRSFPEILEEVTRSIEPLMLKERGRQPAFSELVPGRLTDDQGGSGPRVSFWLACDEDGQSLPFRDPDQGMRLEARALIDDVLRERESGVSWNQMALLVRSGNRIDTILSALRDANIPYSFDRDPDKAPSREIMDVISLLRAIVNPSDTLSLSAWLTSSWVGLPQKLLWQFQNEGLFAEIATLGLKSSSSVDFVRENWLEGKRDLSEVARNNVVLCLHCLADARSTLKELSPELWADRVRANFLFEAGDAIRRQGKRRLDKLTEFWDRFVLRCSNFPGSVQRILDELEVSLAYGTLESPKRFQGEYGDAIEVSTIHNSKGRDWENVYLLRTDFYYAKPPDTEIFRDDELQGVQLLGRPNPQYEAVRRDRKQDDEAEQVRLLYVAMTRAKNRLVVSGCFPVRSVASEKSFMGMIASKTFPTESFLENAIERLSSGEHFFDDSDSGRRFVLPCRMIHLDRKFSFDVENMNNNLDVESLVKRDREIEDRKRLADIRSNRLLHGVASEKADFEEDRETVLPKVTPSEVNRKSALIIGEVVHKTLQNLFGDSLSETKQKKLIDSIKSELSPELSSTDRNQIFEETAKILRTFFKGALYKKFIEIYPNILARELPILSQPLAGDKEPLHSIAGSIDLFYRETSGAWVIADYKTDRISMDDAEVLGKSYLRQGKIYVKAVQKSFKLPAPPIFELWWLRTQEVTRL